MKRVMSRPMNHKDEYLTPTEAARLLRITTRTLKRWEDAGRITSRRLPNNYRLFLREDIEALITHGGSAA